ARIVVFIDFKFDDDFVVFNIVNPVSVELLAISVIQDEIGFVIIQICQILREVVGNRQQFIVFVVLGFHPFEDRTGLFASRSRTFNRHYAVDNLFFNFNFVAFCIFTFVVFFFIYILGLSIFTTAFWIIGLSIFTTA